MDLNWILPQPEPVAVGAEVYLASPLRLMDLARLQGYLRSAAPCPLDAARPAIDAAEDGSEARRRLLRDAYRACQEWPARLGSAEGRALLATGAGFRFWLAVVLGVEQPGMTSGDVERAAATITVGQHGALCRVAYGAPPLDELSRRITPDSFPERPEEPVNWGAVAADLVESTGWTFAEIGALRVTQLAALRSKGKAGSGAVEPPPGMGRFAFARRQRHFFGPDRDGEDAS